MRPVLSVRDLTIALSDGTPVTAALSFDIMPGEILVTRATNVGWTVAFHKVSAIVTDIGAPLSHAAIVAREFGIPAVVGCRNATTVLKTGDVVTVDGAKGTVSVVNHTGD